MNLNKTKLLPAQEPILITTSGITTASTRYRKALRTSIPAPIVNMLELQEGQTLIWSQITIDGKNFITLKGGDKKTKPT